MTNDEKMTKLEWRTLFPGYLSSDFVIHFFRFSKSSRKSDAVRALPAKACELQVLTPALHEQPCVQTASLHAALLESSTQRRHSKTLRRTRRVAFRISSFLRHSSFELRHSYHPLIKKIPVRTAFMTNIASNACTTEAVVAWPTPSAPPSTVSPALHAIVMTIQAKTTLLIIPEYKSHVSALSNARST